MLALHILLHRDAGGGLGVSETSISCSVSMSCSSGSSAMLLFIQLPVRNRESQLLQLNNCTENAFFIFFLCKKIPYDPL